MPKIKKLIVKKYISDDDIKKLKGEWIDESYMKYPLINSNVDVYYLDEKNNEKLLLKFRKNVFTQSEIHLGWKSYKDLAKPSRGRGASAGPINKENKYWQQRTLVNTKKWATNYLKKDGTPSTMQVNNQVLSNPVGYFEAGNKIFNLPCRLTHFTKMNYEKYQEGLPFIQKIDKLYQKLVPDCYKKQYERANIKKNYTIPETCFSTITINRNFRTALHKDGGDYKEGFGNLVVIERGLYHGGYTILPQFGVAVDVRSGDFLAMDVHQYHANTKIYETDEDKKHNQKLEKVFFDNPNIGTEGIYTDYTRLTFVCYLREKMINCSENIQENI